MSSIKLGYSTYAMRDIDVYEVLPRLRSIGYEALEIMGQDGWATAPAAMNSEERKRMSGTVQELGLELSAIMSPLTFYDEVGDRPTVVEQFRAICDLANDLWFEDSPPVVSSPLSGSNLRWERDHEWIVQHLVDILEIACDEGVILAAEPHVGSVLDTPEKAVRLIEILGHPSLRLNFDISHFHVQGIGLRRCIDLCLPYAAHIHVKDGYLDDGRVVFQLPGEGSLDLREYFRLLVERGVNCPVIAEVSAMLWRRSDYDPWLAAERSYVSLFEAKTPLV